MRLLKQSVRKYTSAVSRAWRLDGVGNVEMRGNLQRKRRETRNREKECPRLERVISSRRSRRS